MDCCNNEVQEPLLEKTEDTVNHSTAVDIGKLNEYLLEMALNQLPALDQVAVSRVCKRFNDVALKSTTVLDVEDIPQEHCLEVVQKMPKLVSIVGLGYEDVSFVKSVAKVNKKIVHLKSQDGNQWLVPSYIEAAKTDDANYTPSALFPPLDYEDYEEMTAKYQDMDLKIYLCDPGREEYIGDMDSDLAVTEILDYDLYTTQGTDLLNRMINVTRLEITIRPDDREFTLFPFLDTIARLPLKDLTLNVYEFLHDDSGSIGHAATQQVLYDCQRLFKPAKCS